MFFQVTEQGDDETITPYLLHQAIVDPDDSVTESEGNNDAASPDAITAPLIEASAGLLDTDFFRFRVASGVRIAVIVDDDPDRDGVATDTEVSIIESDGVTEFAAGSGDNDDSAAGNAAGTVTAPGNGTFFVRVSAGDALALETNYRFVVVVEGVVYVDRDADNVPDAADNCPLVANAGQ